MNRRFLKLMVFGMLVVGVAAASIPFIGSLKPSAKAESLATKISIRDIRPGTYVETEYLWWKIFVLRDYDDELYVYSVPYYGQQYNLPDIRWSCAYYPCTDFGPDSDGNALVKNGLFRCRESEWPWIEDSVDYTWSFPGKNQGTYVEDMQVPRYEETWSYIIIKSAS